LGFSLDRNVARQHDNFNLLVHRDAAILFRLPIEIAKHGVRERANRCEMRCRDRVLAGNDSKPDIASSPESKIIAQLFQALWLVF
jgi:hypothetical protein